MLSLGIMMGLTAMLCWGVADFLQAIVIKKIGSEKTLLIAGIISLVFSIFLFAGYFALGNKITMNLFTIAVLFFFTILQVFGTYNFMKSFVTGEVSIVAPISGTYSLITVVLSVLFLGEILSFYKSAAILLVVSGIVLVSTDISKLLHLHTLKGVKEALIAVLCWGIYFFVLGYIKTIYMAQNPVENAKLLAGDLFVLTNLFSSVFMILLGMRMKTTVSRKDFSKSITAIFAVNLVLYTAAWAAINIGLVTELVSLLTPISSIYPAVTVLLASIFLKERLVKNQYIGMAILLVGIFMLGF